MGTKEHLLTLLETQKGVYLSGEEIADRLSISRTAVWKAIKSLQSEGYAIDAVRNKGYSLSIDTDILSIHGIRKYLKPVCETMDLNLFSTVSSTNTLVREKAIAGFPEGYIAIANAQTDGRGRSGRSFFSPPDTGIYMSLLLRPHHYSSKQAVRLTTMAAVAACEAIEAVSGIPAQIKWVNDIYVNQKKAGGILTEASLGLEDGALEYVILGIGLNVSPPKEDFPEELRPIAGSIFSEAPGDAKNHLAAEFLNHFMTYYSNPSEYNYADNYRQRSLVLGKEVQVVHSDRIKHAIAIDINDACQLLVRYPNGQTELLTSGEIRFRLPQL